MNIEYLQRKPSKSEVKEGSLIIAAVRDEIKLFGRNRGRLWSETLASVEEDRKEEVLEKLYQVFKSSFSSDIQSGHGADVWLDNAAKVNLEVDILRVRDKIANKESELQQLKCSNGTLCISQSAKIKKISK